MKTKNKWLLLAGISSAIGGMTGSASGSNSWIIVAIVSAVTSVLIAWLSSSFIK